VVKYRLFPSLSALSLAFFTCGCDAEKISGVRSGDAQCPCEFRGGTAGGRRGETTRSGRRGGRATLQATIPSLLVSSDCKPPAENNPLLKIFSRLKVLNMCRI